MLKDKLHGQEAGWQIGKKLIQLRLMAYIKKLNKSSLKLDQ